jgi:hypothetical protein
MFAFTLVAVFPFEFRHTKKKTDKRTPQNKKKPFTSDNFIDYLTLQYKSRWSIYFSIRLRCIIVNGLVTIDYLIGAFDLCFYSNIFCMSVDLYACYPMLHVVLQIELFRRGLLKRYIWLWLWIECVLKDIMHKKIHISSTETLNSNLNIRSKLYFIVCHISIYIGFPIYILCRENEYSSFLLLLFS